MTRPTAVFILAAGSATRWGNYMGVPKHLIEIDGEPLLHRLVRQCRDIADADVTIIAADANDPSYHVEGARTEAAIFHPAMRDADKFLSSAHLWSRDARNVLLYGDCYITDDAMRLILDPRPLEDGWHAYARFTPSEITGTPWGENFAHVVDPEAIDLYVASLLELPEKVGNWYGGRCGGWEQYLNLTTGNPQQPAFDAGHSTHIDDWSDDFDYPEDYDRWIARRAASTA